MWHAYFWYGLLKVLSFVAAGAFGTLGLLTKYKEDDGRITRAGKVALGGIILSALLSLTMFVLETTRAKEAARRAEAEATATAKLLGDILVNARTTVDQQRTTLRQTEGLAARLKVTADLQRSNLDTADRVASDMQRSLVAQDKLQAGNRQILSGVEHTVAKQTEVMELASMTLRDTRRLLHPIDSLQMRVHLTIPAETAGMSEYLSQVAPTLDPLRRYTNQLGNWDATGVEKVLALGLSTPMPGGIGIPEGSPYHPSAATKGRLGEIVTIQVIELAFYDHPIDPDSFSPFDRRTDQAAPPDIRAVLAPKSDSPFLLHYFGSDHNLGIRGDLTSDPTEWVLSGKLMSVEDLQHGELYITLGYPGRAVGEYEMDRFPERAQFSFSHIYLRIAKQDFVIEGHQLRQYVTRDGIPFWVFSFSGLPQQSPSKPAT